MDRRSPNRRLPGPSKPDPVDPVEDEDEEMPGPSDPRPQAAPAPSAPGPSRRPGFAASSGPGPIRRAQAADPSAPGPSGLGSGYLDEQPSYDAYSDFFRRFQPSTPPTNRFQSSASSRGSPYQLPSSSRSSPYQQPGSSRGSPYQQPSTSQASSSSFRWPVEGEITRRHTLADAMAHFSNSMGASSQQPSASRPYSSRLASSSQGLSSQPPPSSQPDTSQLQPSSSQSSTALSCSAQAQQAQAGAQPFANGPQLSKFFRSYMSATLDSTPKRPILQRKSRSLKNSPAVPDPAARRRIVSTMNAEQSNRHMLSHRVPPAKRECRFTTQDMLDLRNLNPNNSRRRSRNTEDDDDDLPGPSRRSRSRSPLSRRTSGRTQGTEDSLSPGNRSRSGTPDPNFAFEANDPSDIDEDDELEDARQGGSNRSSPASGRGSKLLESPKPSSSSARRRSRSPASAGRRTPPRRQNPPPVYRVRRSPSPSQPSSSTVYFPRQDLGPRPPHMDPRTPPLSHRVNPDQPSTLRRPPRRQNRMNNQPSRARRSPYPSQPSSSRRSSDLDSDQPFASSQPAHLNVYQPSSSRGASDLNCDQPFSSSQPSRLNYDDPSSSRRSPRPTPDRPSSSGRSRSPRPSKRLREESPEESAPPPPEQPMADPVDAKDSCPPKKKHFRLVFHKPHSPEMYGDTVLYRSPHGTPISTFVPTDEPSPRLRPKTPPPRRNIPPPSTRNPPPGYYYGRQEADRRFDGSTANRRLVFQQPEPQPSDDGQRTGESENGGYNAEPESESDGEK
uniref:CRC domain-containing protein n=1 Tax=Panagrellus redivivus TaxID=6233 RepID=A0A7E4VW07_PANRE